MLKIGIIGANGFIGSRAVEILRQNQEYEVIPIVRNSSTVENFSNLGLKYHIADALDQSALAAAFADCDVVLHSAIGSPSFLRNTVVATYKAAEKAKVRRIVYLSTGCVHSLTPPPGTDENSPLSDRQPIAYNNAKVQAERKLLQLRAKGSTEVVILRPMIVFGVGDPRMLGMAEGLLNKSAYLINGGKGICSTIYIDNLIHAITLAMTAPDADKEAFIVGDKEQVTWGDLYGFIAKALGIEMSQIHNIQMPYVDSSTYTLSWKRRLLEGLRNSDILNKLSSLLPEQSKQLLKGNLKKSLESSSSEPGTIPTITPEMALLYLSQYKLPIKKAEKILGYEPIVSFPEACRRTVEWLASKGYPVTIHN
jgi:2-alkyl-3-oxoalkanoate reductase